MALLERRTGLPLYDQRLIAGGRELNPEQTLDQLNVKTKETLYLFQRQDNICASWAATGNCKDRKCAHAGSHTVANSPRYVEYATQGGLPVSQPAETPTHLKEPQPSRKHALEIRCPRTHDLEQLVLSPVPAFVAEMRLGDWEPEATFAQRVRPSQGAKACVKAWPELAQIPSVSWDFFSDTRKKDAGCLEFDVSAGALLMNSEMPLDSRTLKQQASSWESTEEAREEAYSAWVASQSQKFQCAVEATA